MSEPILDRDHPEFGTLELEPDPGTRNFTMTMPPTDPRDVALGAFMGEWSDLEGVLEVLLWRLMGSPLDVARAVFASGIGIAQLKDLLIALGRLRLKEAEQADLARLAERLKRLNTKRNRIVHARWIIVAAKGSQKSGAPKMTEHWLRAYLPPDPEIIQRMMDPLNQKESAAYTFKLSAIFRVAKELRRFREELEQFALRCPKPQPFSEAPPPTG